jgi:hypothetical protein
MLWTQGADNVRFQRIDMKPYAHKGIDNPITDQMVIALLLRHQQVLTSFSLNCCIWLTDACLSKLSLCQQLKQIDLRTSLNRAFHRPLISPFSVLKFTYIYITHCVDCGEVHFCDGCEEPYCSTRVAALKNAMCVTPASAIPAYSSIMVCDLCNKSSCGDCGRTDVCEDCGKRSCSSCGGIDVCDGCDKSSC